MGCFEYDGLSLCISGGTRKHPSSDARALWQDQPPNYFSVPVPCLAMLEARGAILLCAIDTGLAHDLELRVRALGALPAVTNIRLHVL